MQHPCPTEPARRKDKHPSLRLCAYLPDAALAALLRLLGPVLWGKLYTLLSSLRCFCGHICTQLAKDQVSVNLGPALERKSGSYLPNRRTGARREGIENLRAIHPWADLLSLEIFLMGFDAGERWGLHTSRTTPHPGLFEDSSAPSPSSGPIIDRKKAEA
jgi:hypothetical protein